MAGLSDTLIAWLIEWNLAGVTSESIWSVFLCRKGVARRSASAVVAHSLEGL